MDEHETHTDSNFPILERMEAGKLAVAMELLTELYGITAAVNAYQVLRDHGDIGASHELILEEWPDLATWETEQDANFRRLDAGTKAAMVQIDKHLGGAA